jgi:hypothetical protein
MKKLWNLTEKQKEAAAEGALAGTFLGIHWPLLIGTGLFGSKGRTLVLHRARGCRWGLAPKISFDREGKFDLQLVQTLLNERGLAGNEENSKMHKSHSMPRAIYPGRCRSRFGSRWRSADHGFLGVVILDELNRLLRAVNEELNGFGIPNKQYHSRLQHAQCTARVL